MEGIAGGKGSHFSFSKEDESFDRTRFQNQNTSRRRKKSRGKEISTKREGSFTYIRSEREKERLLDHSPFIDFSSRDKSLIEEERRRRERKKVASIRVERIVRK